MATSIKAKLWKGRTKLFEDMHTISGLDIRDPSLITLFLYVIGIIIPNIR